ncbi:MAG: Sec-independent protein translocase protein TatB [Actinomycetota bacterium]
MSFGLTIEKLALIGLIALLVVGPERLPGYAQSLANLVKKLREMARGAESRLRDEVGDDFDIEELKKLDPRQYDPRRIIREALVDEPSPKPARLGDPSKTVALSRAAATAPFDSEAT